MDEGCNEYIFSYYQGPFVHSRREAVEGIRFPGVILACRLGIGLGMETDTRVEWRRSVYTVVR